VVPSRICRDIEGYLDRLPFDRHESITLVTLNGLLLLESDIEWLESLGSTVCANGERLVYEAVRMNGTTRISTSGVDMSYALSEEHVPTVEGIVGHVFNECNRRYQTLGKSFVQESGE
jgi:hypothetical protein